ncbi:hypothetical protein [Rubripirellula reticaptiva]|uniref:Uncharacterized protein n=1 Tax=Rubripirellula reticaptiva TaxID=2528013 RepID=A0A5C6ENW2_9BACT|nr:hypothetical protein [Rubripirellula reticaptiva]TWU51443.1 hypothetical protein Poly59_30350 [Rubripirellula reticaptiva]
MAKTLADDMTLVESLSYVLAQYDAPKWLSDHIATVADNWETRKDAPNYGKPEHPEGFEGWCLCDECLASA